jgi:DNA recombination protein RmuC
LGFAVAWTLGFRAREQLAEARVRADEQARAAADKLELLAATKSSMSDAFKALSAESLDRSNERFLALAAAKLEKVQAHADGELAAREKAVGALVQPIADALTQVDGKLGELERTSGRSHAVLNEQLRSLVETQLPLLGRQAANLEKALRQPSARGRWGEMQLKRVVEMAGMLEHCDFLEQPSASTDEGRLRPDLIVKLPGGKQVIVDAKAPLEAFLDAAGTEDDAEREASLAKHAALVRGHMTALRRKAYWETFSQTPELVIMFLPGEDLLSGALRSDPSLLELGANEKVLLATPVSLIGLLRAIAMGWREEALAINAREVADLGKELYERIARLASTWNQVGDKLGKAVEAYNKSVGTLETRVLVTARKFEDLRAAPDGEEIEAPEPVDTVPRPLTAKELVEPAPAPAPTLERVVRIGQAPSSAAN